ncbi:MAG: hypothetical protein GF411_11330 [Candidatus Lokiarchaeota archaeon]|nr:hypothetical protein [Candidatus Lokiarchaeota archaeon]
MSKARQKPIGFEDEFSPFVPRTQKLNEPHSINDQDAFVQMTRQSPEFAYIWYEFGKHLLEEGELEAAEDALLTSVEIDENIREAWLKLVWIYEILGFRQEANMAIDMVELLTEEENDLINTQFFGDGFSFDSP